MEGRPEVVTAGSPVDAPRAREPGHKGVSGTVGDLGLPVAAIASALVRRPDLWATALRAGLSLAPTGWWRRPPFLPLPDGRWLRFRLATAYGGDGRFGPDSPFDVDDLITWLEWRKAWPG